MVTAGAGESLQISLKIFSKSFIFVFVGRDGIPRRIGNPPGARKRDACESYDHSGGF
jgi:hypothetical protein